MALFLALFPSLCRRVLLLSRCAWVNRVQGGRISLLSLSMPASLTQSCFVLRPHLVQSRYRAITSALLGVFAARSGFRAEMLSL